MEINLRRTYLAAMIASILALVAIGIQFIATAQFSDGLSPQPYGQPIDVLQPSLEENSNSALLFFAGDTLFPLSYLVVFAGLFAVVRQTSPVFAWLGIGAGILTVFLDLLENAFFITYALLNANGGEISQYDLIPLTIIGTLKWTVAFATLYIFALVFPLSNWLERVIAILMFAFPLFGIASVAFPALIPWRGIFLLFGMVFFAIFFRSKYLATTDELHS